MRLCPYDLGNAKGFSCSYHGWAYDTAGTLIGVPHEHDGYNGRTRSEVVVGAQRRETRHTSRLDLRDVERARAGSAHLSRTDGLVARRYARSLAGGNETHPRRLEMDGAVQLEVAGRTIHERLLSFSDHARIGDRRDAPAARSADRTRVQQNAGLSSLEFVRPRLRLVLVSRTRTPRVDGRTPRGAIKSRNSQRYNNASARFKPRARAVTAKSFRTSRRSRVPA